MGRHSEGVSVFVKYGLVDKGYIEKDFLESEYCKVLVSKGCSIHFSNDLDLCFPLWSTRRINSV